MPDGSTSIPVSLRVPAEMLEKLDNVAAACERPRSWVMLRALRQYLEDEGQEMLDIQLGIAEYERGEYVTSEKLFARMDELIGRADAKHNPG